MSLLPAYIAALAFTAYLLYLLLRPKPRADHSEAAPDAARIAAFKAGANAYELDFDHCTFRDSSYLLEVEEHQSDYALAGRLAGSSIGYFHTPVVQKEMVRSVLLYHLPASGRDRRLYQVFSMDVTTLKYHVLQGHIILYIDKTDDRKYLFDFLPAS